jgi:hypothetical protein
MTRVRDLEKSLRNILSAQLRELVKRCVPKAEWVDREQISTLLDGMINAWVKAEPEARPAVLGLWLEKINSHVAAAKAVTGVKAGKSLAVSSRLPHHMAKAAGPIGQRDARLPFELVETKLGKLSPPRRQTRPYEVKPYEVKTEKIAALLNLSNSKVEVIRGKLRDSGFDFSLLNANYIEASRKNAGRRAAGSKPPRGN